MLIFHSLFNHSSDLVIVLDNIVRCTIPCAMAKKSSKQLIFHCFLAIFPPQRVVNTGGAEEVARGWEGRIRIGA